MITNEMKTQVLELYTAYFNRAADRDGVAYWLNEMDANGWNIDMVAQSFADQSEYTNIYGSMTNAQIVSQVYHNVLNRDADATGAAYWESELSSGAIPVNQLIQAVINAAKEDVDNLGDDYVLANKSTVSEYCYDSNINETNISLASVTKDYNSIDNVIAYIDGEIGGGDTSYQEFLSTDIEVLSALITLNTYTGELSNASIREQVIAFTGSDAYNKAFDPSNYEGSNDGIFTTEELGFSHLSNLPATAETIESLFYGTIINALKAIDMDEVLSIEDFFNSHASQLEAGNEAIFNSYINLMVSIMTSPTSSPILDDATISETTAKAGEMFVELVAIGDNPTLFDGVLIGL